MFPKTFILLFCLIQGYHTEHTVDDVIVALTSKISIEKATIDVILQNGGISIRFTHAAIGQIVTNAETTIHGQLDQLDNIVQQAEQEAKQKGVDVSKCTNDVTVALSNVDIGRIHNCSRNYDLELLGIQMDNLREVKKDLSKSINICLGKNPDDLGGLEKCVEADIKNAEFKIEEIQDRISSVCKEAKEIAAVCAETVVKDMDKIISSVAHDLKICLSTIL